MSFQKIVGYFHGGNVQLNKFFTIFCHLDSLGHDNTKFLFFDRCQIRQVPRNELLLWNKETTEPTMCRSFLNFQCIVKDLRFFCGDESMLKILFDPSKKAANVHEFFSNHRLFYSENDYSICWSKRLYLTYNTIAHKFVNLQWEMKQSSASNQR